MAPVFPKGSCAGSLVPCELVTDLLTDGAYSKVTNPWDCQPQKELI
jgi:hypothetical protein